MTLQNFPRGGKKVPAKKIKPNNNTSTVQKKQKNVNQKAKDEESIHSLNDAKNLSFLTVQPGTNILCRIHKVFKLDFIVSLPGFLSAKVSIVDISSSYTNILKQVMSNGSVDSNEFKGLQEIFKPGDYVICNVTEMLNQSKFLCKCSMAPAAVNANVNPSFLTTGCTVVCSVSSIEDNGYIIETGMSNVRAFLSKKNAVNDTYSVGKQLICFIKKININDNIYTLDLSLNPKHKKQLEQEKQSLDNMLPGSQYNLIVNRILPSGIEVLYNKNKVGYINQIHLPRALKSYSIGNELTGTLMYVIQLYKFPFFTALSPEIQVDHYQIGDIIENAKYCNKESGGILLKIAKKVRVYVPNRRTGVDYLNFEKVFTRQSVHKCRIIGYSSMDYMYVCTMEKPLLQEKLFSKLNFEIGHTYDVKITCISKENWIEVRCGRVMGVIPPDEIKDKNQDFEPQMGQTVVAKVLRQDPNRNKVIFSTRESIVNNNLPILTDALNVRIGEHYLAIVNRVDENGLQVFCLGGARGWIPEENLKKPITLKVEDKKQTKEIKSYYRKQAFAAVAVNVIAEKNTVVLRESSVTYKEKVDIKNELKNFPIGTEVEGTVVEASMEGIRLKISGLPDNETGFLPPGHLAPCYELGNLISAKTELGDKLKAVVFSNYPSLILTNSISPIKDLTIKKINVGDLIPCSLLNQGEFQVKVIIPCEDFYGTAWTQIVLKDELKFAYSYQMKLGLVTSIDRQQQIIKFYTGFNDVWEQNPDSVLSAVDLLSLYLKKVFEYSQMSYFKNKPLSLLKIGEKIKGKVTKVTESGLILELNGGAIATVRKEHYEQSYKIGDEVLAAILWVNYFHELAEVTIIPRIVNQISTKPLDKTLIDDSHILHGIILYVNNWFAIILLKSQGKHSLAAIPIRYHLNEIKPNISNINLYSKIKCYGVLHQSEINLPLSICIQKALFEDKIRNPFTSVNVPNSATKRKNENEKLPKEKKQKSKKIKIEETNKDNDENDKICEGENSVKEEELEEDTVKSEDKELEADKEITENDTLEADNELVKNEIVETLQNEVETENKSQKRKRNKDKAKREAKKTEENKSISLEMPECGFFWDTTPNKIEIKTDESSSSSEDEIEDNQPIKKKKLSAAERREEERKKERAIREREEFLASGSKPISADQFDRLVLARPNSSLTWIEYMSFHLQMAEIDKARAVARRAINTINFREEEEKLNVSKAWLNLESKFGTVDDSLKEVFNEAVKINDPAKIYQHMLMVHADAGRHIELENTVRAICGKNGKFKENPDMWVECGAVLLKCNLKEKSRLLMQRALQSLPAHQHVNLMIRFAYLENKYGDKERSQTLFEQVLASYPKRTDIWISYIDIAIKSGKTETARQILDRAISQAIPPKKMKSIFKKYLAFETQYGTPERVAEVRSLAAKYVEDQCKHEN